MATHVRQLKPLTLNPRSTDRSVADRATRAAFLERLVGGTRNRLLDAIAATGSGPWLLSQLRSVTLEPDEVLHEQGEPPTKVYFPAGSLVSLTCEIPEGWCCELTTLDPNGMAGISALVGSVSTGGRATVVAGGKAWQLPAAVLHQAFAADTDCQRLLMRYMHCLLLDISMHSLCDLNHSIEQRLARVLIHAMEHGALDSMKATHELLAARLGVRRESVSVVAGQLQAQGVLQYHRGRIRVVNHAKLSHLACNCHQLVRTEYERLYQSQPAPAAVQ
jgi:CRP-like cAMP-binding protein